MNVLPLPDTGSRSPSAQRVRLLKIGEVKKLTSLSKSTVYRLMSDGEFPLQLKLSKQSAAWLESEILEWIDALANARDVEGE
ncbi:MAG: AlpA family transcriptional regulator [Gammaproteobacteria bacterium]|jgi:prophage regulatory protein|nr:AlpA family transcriptional regulator [Gammaproteobacteria bacterium]